MCLFVVVFCFFLSGEGGLGHAFLAVLEVATQTVLDTIFEIPSVLNWE